MQACKNDHAGQRRYKRLHAWSPATINSGCLRREYREWDISQAPVISSSMTSWSRSYISIVTLILTMELSSASRLLNPCSLWDSPWWSSTWLSCLFWKDYKRMAPKAAVPACKQWPEVMQLNADKTWKTLDLVQENADFWFKANEKKIEWFSQNPLFAPKDNFFFFLCWHCSFCGWKMPNLLELASSCF